MDVASVRRSSRLRDNVDVYSFASNLVVKGKQCGACLLEISALGFGPEEEVAATLESCAPEHVFHAGCIFTWMQMENSCPLCKQRFERVGLYSADGVLLRTARASTQEQEDMAASDSDPEEVVCEVCHRADDDAALLLCDGRDGHCNVACHYYCGGLPGVPDGDWFCSSCSALRQREAPAEADIEAPTSVPSRPQAQNESPVASVATPRNVGSGKKFACLRGNRTRAQVSGQQLHLDLDEGEEQSQTTPTSKSFEEALVRGLPQAGPEVFGGLCKEMPKWISRQGDQICVDLGGRRIRDTTAPVLGQVIQAALSHTVRSLNTNSSAFSVALLLNGTRLRKLGLTTLLESVSSSGIRLSRLELERNRLDNVAASWLAEWCLRQKDGAPDEMFMSRNLITDAGATQFLSTMARCASARPLRKKQMLPPLWVEMGQNRIRDATSMLDTLSATVQVCLALDPSACSAKRCASTHGDGAVEPNDAPLLHLHGILTQACDEVSSAEDAGHHNEKRVRCKEGPEDRGATPAKVPRIKAEPSDDVTSVVSRATSQDERETRRALLASRAEARAQSFQQRGIGNTRDVEQMARRALLRDGASNPSATRTSMSSGSSPLGSTSASNAVNGCGSNSDERELRSQSQRDTQDSPPDQGGSQLPGRVDAAMAERQRWAQSLGKKASVLSKAFDENRHLQNDIPPGYGLWDMVKRPMTTQEKKIKRQNSAKVISTVPSTPASSNTPAVSSSASIVTSLQSTSNVSMLPLQDSPSLSSLASSERIANVSNCEHQQQHPGRSMMSAASSMLTRRHSFSPEENAAALREFIIARLAKWGKRLWSKWKPEDQSLRRRCFTERLYRMASSKYQELVVDTSGCWVDYLRNRQNQQQMARWVDKKVREFLGASDGSRA
eukprot:TRINITY_DN8560_c0_g2_i1.p1 TRINITY_DN8560_c0_g2~~TRINITY_DN8560_c0_g2_i1.p1  ORF type:complete len:897 (-),score=114.15 TRINITY_DN8560_c0_g2_i1:13-2703(-)